MRGDRLASGARSASFIPAQPDIDNEQMRKDLRQLPAQAFKDKYMVNEVGYQHLLACDGEDASDLLREMREHTEAIERLTRMDAKQDQSLDRECFIVPFYEPNIGGRVIVARDKPTVKSETSNLALPKHLRKERTRLPTTGHIIKASVAGSWLETQENAFEVQFLGKRILFSPMSGTAIAFAGYPTWIQLEVSEILAIVHKEDAEVIEEEVEPLV